MDLKTISQRLGIRDRTLRYVLENDSVQGVTGNNISPGTGTARDLDAEQVYAVVLAAILHEHGFRGPAIREVINRTKVQIDNGKSQLQVDFRGELPVTLRLDIAQVRRKLDR